MNYISIENLKVFAHHGVFPEETKHGQDFFVSAKLYLDTTAASHGDCLEKSVNYGDVCHRITTLMQEKTFRLIESAAEYLAQTILSEYPLLTGIELTLDKPHAPVGLPFENIGIHIIRNWHEACLGIGSNMGDKEEFLNFALKRLDETPGCQVMKVSDFIVTAPYGGVEQDDFLNGAVLLRTFLEPSELLDLLHKIEAEAGRERLIHWGPRTLDLDILLYDDLVTEQPDLIIPHPDMTNRGFVMTPLSQIAGYKIHPLLKQRISEIKVS